MILGTQEPPQPGNANLNDYETMEQGQHFNESITDLS